MPKPANCQLLHPLLSPPPDSMLQEPPSAHAQLRLGSPAVTNFPSTLTAATCIVKPAESFCSPWRGVRRQLFLRAGERDLISDTPPRRSSGKGGGAGCDK
ncbi:hypothetical protein E2C01_025709 [Portunus trituberculatus]|uniref:Uncharacterized protein n=1 Tax=Portunus trituberculatus TaxID=210409 RepID=A0A5B7EGN6_PORTR|nr:hypothetical protein [Portunus trituberculatus]